ncbi:hypothetical protein EPN95_04190 [Patescibacteria group bacterium]|nr:MAG: hypothetical protein EPN95_04190 [Patescibacteria group bacterium]
MFLVGILTWWYGDGWRERAVMVGGRIARSNDYFSVGLLLSTLFSPFRQISAGRVDGSFATQLRAIADKLISRMIGAIIRSFMIVFGLVVILLQAIFGGVVLAVWLFVPLFPIIGLLMMVIGWVPSWR